MAAKIIQAGEMPPSQIRRAAPTGMISCRCVSLIERAAVRQGTTMSATTAGRNHLNAFSTHSFSRAWVKKRAMARMMRKEGRIVPNAQQTAPNFFRNL